MTAMLFIAVAIGAFLLWYALAGRKWLKTKPWAAGFFAAIEPVEIALYKKSETILWARFKMLIGVTLAGLTTLGGIDLTPIMPLVPEAYQGLVHTAVDLLPLLITLVGMADERLRNQTTRPVELVAIPDKVIAENPVVAQTVAAADVTKDQAVAAVQEAKAA